jgi:hemolysin activation/secretion protein
LRSRLAPLPALPRAVALCLVPPLAAWPVLPVLAQSTPNAGSLLQQMQRDSTPRLPARADPPRAAEPPEEWPRAAGVKLRVTAFRFAGNTLLADAELQRTVAPWLNQTLDLNELRKAAGAVAQAYRAAGWVVRAYLPRQDVTDGMITIQIIEATFGGARAESPSGAPPLRLKLDRVLRYVDAAQTPGEPVSSAALDRALLLIEDLPGVAVSGVLTPGRRSGETDLVLKLSDTPLISGDARLDNAGGRSTGATRYTASVALNSPLGYGEQATASALHTQGLDYLRLGASLPLGASGLRVGVNGSTLRYRLTSSEFAALDAHGDSDTLGVEASYPLVRARLQNLFLNFNAERKRFNNLSGGAVVTRYRVNTYAAGLQGNHFDNWLGGGANTAGVTFITGHVDLNGSPNQAADALTTRTAGDFTKLRYNVARRQTLTQQLYVIAAVTGQWANKNLDSSEKFYLGGPGGVRAYPVNEGGGASGQLANLEARLALPANLTLSGFYDWGRVVVNRTKDFPGAAVINEVTLKGAGIALAWNGPHNTQWRATWARRIGSNPNPTLAGLDQDGSKTLNRIWLSASISF